MATKETKFTENKLRDEVAEKYRTVRVRAAKYDFHGFGVIDLRAITLKKADELYKKGFPFLKLKGEPDNAEADKKAAALDEAKEALKEANVEELNYQEAKKLFIALDLKAEDLKEVHIKPALEAFKETL